MTKLPARRRRWWKYLLITTLMGLVALLAGLWYTTTNSFQQYVRRRMVEELERITGGKAEIGSFHVVPFHLQVEVRNITVHGKEGPNEVPLAHADSLQAQVKVISLLRTEFGFHSLILDHPVVHIAISPDGTTNIPALRELPQTTGTDRVAQLFALSIDRLIVHNGELLWADREVPLDFSVHNTNLQMEYSFLRGRYESHLMIGKVDTGLKGLRPFSWTTTMDFALAPTFAEIKSLKWTSGKTFLQASGRISDFHNPRLEGSYEARFNLQEAGAIARRNELNEGTAEFKGSGNWTLSDFSTSGTLQLRDFGWQDEQFALRKAAASADFSVSGDEIKLSKLQGKLLGGSFSGDAQVDNWLHSIPLPSAGKAKKEDLPVISAARPAPKKGEKPKLAGVQGGAVHLRLRDLSVGETAAALDVPAHPLANFHPSGSVGGNVDATWKENPANAEIAFNLDVDPPQRPAPRELPITAHLQGKYRGATDSLELSQFKLSTPDSNVVADGVLADTSKLRISVSTSNLEEWRPLVTAFGGPTNLPFRVNGHATFTGNAGGTFSSPTIAGSLQAEDFEFTVPATSRTAQNDVHWDSLGASILFSSREVSLRGGTLRHGETSADFEATASLLKGKFTDNTPFTAHVNVHHVDVASTAAFSGLDYPITGTADASVQVAGTQRHTQVQGHIHAVDASAYGEEIGKFDADLRVGAAETELANIRLTHQDAEVTGSARYAPTSREIHLDLAGKNFDLSRLRQIHLDELPFDGRADFTLQMTGTLDTPAINASVHVRDFAVDHELQGGFTAQATTNGSNLVVNGHSDFVKGTLAVDGTVSMRGDYAANITARMDRLDLDALWRAYLGQQLTGHSSVVGTLTMQGPVFHTRQWSLSGNLSNVEVDVEYAKMHNQDPVRFTYANRTLHIGQTHMVGEGTDIVGRGAIYYDEARRLDFSGHGRLDLRMLGGLDPNLTTSGQATVHVTVGGTVAEPLAQGSIQIENGAANFAGLPSGISEMNGSLLFTRDRVHIEQLTARTGGGTLDLKGEATNFNQQLSFNVTAIGKDVRLRYPPGVSSTATAELHWVGTRSSSTVSGDVMVTKLAVTPGFDFGSYLERSRQSAAITSANSPLYNVKLDVAVRTAPELQMKTAVARLSGDADLKLRGSVARPSVLGRADILEGDATFNGIKFRLERGDITFANPVAIEPQVNLQATTHVRNYDLDVTVTGTPDRLNVNYRSEPPLPKSDIIALLALGRTSEESEQLQQQSGQGMFSDEATSLIINQAINSTVSSRMEKLFGVSRIKIDPQGLTTETNPTARGPQITIEQEFANNLSLSYSTNVSQSSQQIIQGEYYINRNVSVLGTRDQNGVISFDVRVRQRKK